MAESVSLAESAPLSDSVPRLELRGITKRFPGVVANEDVSLKVMPGEIHALLGENGAGKSTLVKILYGVLHADEGEILWEGKPVTIHNPRAARELGIGMVFQHFSLFEAMTVLENITLGMDEAIPPAQLRARVRAVLETYDLPLDPDREVHTLSLGERQRIEIVRTLLQNPRVLVLDEPTSVLTPQESDKLFEILRQLAREGCSIIYISHKLDEIRRLCDTATILRAGKVVDHCDPSKETPHSLARMMIGADFSSPERTRAIHGAVLLEVDKLSIPAEGLFGVALDHVGFAVHSGEIFGIAGIGGNGQNELLAGLAGEVLAPEAGMIRLDGVGIGRKGPASRRKRGLAAVPEDRQGHGAVAEFSLAENAILTARHRNDFVRKGFVRTPHAHSYATDVVEAFTVKASGSRAQASSLSGGNLQKFIMGREIMRAPRLLVLSQPTWGVDAGAAGLIRQALLDLADTGAAIVLISQDLDELLALSDTIAVINHGRLSAPVPRSEATLETIGLLMGGMQGEDLPDVPAGGEGRDVA